MLLYMKQAALTKAKPATSYVQSVQKERSARVNEKHASTLGMVALHLCKGKPEHPSTTANVIETVRKGLPFKELEMLREVLDLPLEQMAEKLDISRATLHRRKLSGRLGKDESDKLVRYARLAGKAIEVFGDIQRARQWLSFPQYGLGEAVPLDYAQTEIGAREVENLLGRIEYGVYA